MEPVYNFTTGPKQEGYTVYPGKGRTVDDNRYRVFPMVIEHLLKPILRQAPCFKGLVSSNRDCSTNPSQDQLTQKVALLYMDQLPCQLPKAGSTWFIEVGLKAPPPYAGEPFLGSLAKRVHVC